MLAPDQTPIESSISKQPSEDAAEVLVWMGTAYGRRKTAEQKPALVTAATDLRARAAALNHALAALNLPTFAGPARNVMAGAALAFVAALSATWVTGQFDNGTAMDTAGLATFAPAEPVHEAAVAAEPKAPELMPAALPDDRVDRDKLERAARDAADAKSQLASEREARLSAEEKAARLEIATAAERQARQAAETSSAALGSELAAE